MDPELLKTALKEAAAKGKLPKAIIVVHLYGMPAKMEALLEIANDYGVPIIEDAAEALGSKINQKACGSFGKFGVLSFNGNKIITTSSGGALLSDEGAYIEKSKFLATQARDPAPHYQHSHIGYNYRMSNILAGIGRGQLEVLDERVRARRANFDRYVQYFEPLNEKGYQFGFQNKDIISSLYSNRWLSCILIEPDQRHGITRESIRLALENENIESRPLWKPMHQQPVFEGAKKYLNGVSDNLFDKGICLPSGSNLTDTEFQRIFECLDQLLKP